ncbi:hypothetical protein COT42_07930 [Candidatus Saganbacteria bacterium CG08_land_8_20_14_0_20_45_16]|uniref:Uncharacterized protein n=1 Tax=Candidatus Saganbacteria bacterium CG08_land_8_20_14_0_20_45_16 TaxID=2014293 RepID=A0A2H0XWG0_UNCSA|nr:MAG: hypothetical protein COT42_07930 [Candidatus Saganbacteria bacterium CG08_land_8_20_14_0_20_45_16]
MQYAQFVGAESGSDARSSLARALDILNPLAADFRFSRRDLAKWRQTVGNEVPLQDSFVTIGELCAAAPVSLYPAGLPMEVLSILQQTGYGGFISQHINEIIFEVDLDGFGDGHGGEALTSNGIVRINLYDRNEGRMLKPWEIAFVLVHEAAHLAWGRSTGMLVHEAVAYEAEADFLEAYLQGQLDQGLLNPRSPQAREIASEMFSARDLSLVARRLLDNPTAAWEDFEIDPAFTADELDEHQGNNVSLLVREHLPDLIDGLLQPGLEHGERAWLINFFERIMRGEINLEDRSLRRSLSERQTSQLTTFFATAYEYYPRVSRPADQGIALNNYAVTYLLFYLLSTRQAEAYLAAME